MFVTLIYLKKVKIVNGVGIGNELLNHHFLKSIKINT